MEAEPGKAPCPNARGPRCKARKEQRARGQDPRAPSLRKGGCCFQVGPGCLQPASVYAEQRRLRGCPVWSGTFSFGPGTSSQGAPPGHPVTPTCREEVPSVLADSALAPPDAPGTPTHPGPCAAGAAGWPCFGRAAVPGGSVPSRRLWVVPLRCRRQGKSPAENKAHPFHSVPINPSSATVSHARRT